MFSFNSYVYSLTRGFIASTHAFNLKNRGVVVITTAQIHSAKPELRFCAGSYPA